MVHTLLHGQYANADEMLGALRTHILRHFDKALAKGDLGSAIALARAIDAMEDRNLELLDQRIFDWELKNQDMVE